MMRTDIRLETKKGLRMNEIIYVLIFLGIYILLQAYILPKLGIST